jgi:streptogramin lyase
MHNLTADIVPDADDLRVVRERAVIGRRRARLVAGVGALAIAGVVASVVVMIGHGNRNGGDEPLAPTPSSPSSGTVLRLPNPFTVVRTIDAQTAGLSGPLKLAVGPAGQVYVTDRSQHVTELDATGDVVRRWGGRGTAPGKFRLYSGALAVGSDGRVYVADTGNFRIQVFSPDGTFIAQYGGYGQGPGKFVWPSGIAVGDDGSMYVADDRAATITALSPNGVQRWRKGTPAESERDLVGHEHLGGVNGAGLLVTANDDVDKVLFIDTEGRIADSFSTTATDVDVDTWGLPGGQFPRGTCGATFDPQGNIYVASCEESYQRHHDIAVYDPQRGLVAGWMGGPMVDAPVFDHEGHAWAVTSGNRAIIELSVHLPASEGVAP